MLKTLRFFAVALAVAVLFSVAGVMTGCSGDPSLEGLGMPEFVSISAQADDNSLVLTCNYKGRVGTCGFVVTQGGEVVKKQEASTRSDGAFSLIVKNLEYDTEYTYYAWISNGSAEIHSNTDNVRTEKKPITPQVFVSVAANAEGNSISLTCTYEGVKADACGFALTKEGEVVKRLEAETGSDGSFSITIDDLEYDCEYGYYAWIVSGEDEVHSNTGIVRTEQRPVIAPTIKKVSYEADENVLTLYCTYMGDEVNGWGFYFNGTKYGSDSHDDGKFSLTVSDLEYDTDYDYQAYITSGQVEVTSDVKTARTGKLSSVPIPDAVFKAYILNLYDLDRNGKLSMEEAEKITKLEIGTYDLQIKSLEGIEYFKNLEYLKAAGNGEAQPGELSRLDLSKNLKLETLICSFNKLEELYLGNNTALKYVDCSSNCLFYSSNYCPDFSQTTNLEYLDCHSNNSLYVNLGNNTALKYLDCSHTLEQGNFTGCTSLEYLDCSYSRTDYVRIAGLKKLTTLKCEAMGGIIWEFDASGCENLVFDKHIFDGNVFQSFKAVGCNNLTTLNISYNGCAINYIDIRDCKNLKSFKCSGLVVDQLDVRGCTSLTDIECYENFLHELDVSSQNKLNLRAWPQSTNFDKLWIGSGEYHYFNESGQEINPADYGTEVIVKE